MTTVKRSRRVVSNQRMRRPGLPSNEWKQRFGVLRFVVVYEDDDGRHLAKPFANGHKAFQYARTIAVGRSPLVYEVCDPMQDIADD